MSDRYPGGFITKDTPVTSPTSATGVWTLDQAMQATKAGNWPTNGPFFIEDLFSTWLYTGNGSTQTITNGIDLAGEGGLVWTKQRGQVQNHLLADTVRGNTKYLSSNTTGAEGTSETRITSFDTTGYTLGTGAINGSTNTFVSWTFREQPKFFDVVTYTGDGTGNRNIAHNLGSVPGCMINRTTSEESNWQVYHRANTTPNANPESNTLLLNLTNASASSTAWSTAPTATEFTVGSALNDSAVTYAVYLFAHDAGGFGLTGTDNVISCGSFSTDGSGNATVNLGYEPQWLMYKCSNNVGDWEMVDVMRGWVVGVNNDNGLRANSSDAESVGSNRGEPSSTGFNCVSFPTSRDFIYIAIRRGPMKTPTTGTSEFAPVALNSHGSTPNTLLRTTNFPVDFYLDAVRNNGGTAKFAVGSRLQGKDAYLFTDRTGAENEFGDLIDNLWDNNTGIAITATNLTWNGSNTSETTILEGFRRAPGFFDVVCYTGTSDAVGKTVNHNLSVVPELMIVKSRSVTNSWVVYASPLGNTSGLLLNGTNAVLTGRSDFWDSATPTSSVFSIGSTLNANTVTWVAYLFATCPGVSKVGSYTGTGTTQTINCGFTAGARFVLIKRTDSTGDWYVWDSARGIVAGDDPYLLLNSTAAEVTNTDYVDTAATGFEITSTAPAAINASGGSFIFLAIS